MSALLLPIAIGLGATGLVAAGVYMIFTLTRARSFLSDQATSNAQRERSITVDDLDTWPQP